MLSGAKIERWMGGWVGGWVVLEMFIFKLGKQFFIFETFVIFEGNRFNVFELFLLCLFFTHHFAIYSCKFFFLFLIGGIIFTHNVFCNL
jgi:hypothetical protein